MPNKKLRLSSETIYVLSDSIAPIPREATVAIAGGGGMSGMSGSWLAGPHRGGDIPPIVRRWAKPVALMSVGAALKAAYDYLQKK